MNPALQYWFSGPALYLALSFVFVVAVALIGIREMIPHRAFNALVVAAIGLAAMAWYTAAQQEQANEELRSRLIGGKGFCFVIGLYDNAQATTFQLRLSNPGDETLRNIAITIIKLGTPEETADSFMSAAPIFVGMLSPMDSQALGVTLPFGEYTIDIKTEANAFLERLSLQFKNGAIQESYYVKGRGPKGAILFQSGKVPPPSSQQ